MRPAHVQAFIDRVMPYARRAAAATGLPVSVILAQWGAESGWGRNDVARQNNLGAIYGSSGFRSYASLDEFTDDWIRVLHLPYYDAVRAAAATGDADAVARALGESPYDNGHYCQGDGTPGSFLIQIMDDFDLRDFDAST
ncbi:MAG: glucosaminidase domain-containing protein [Firmicutes bacterium]|nr:glucosaminidase domain-containing protein [Bacillota bacterium]